ncbi:MAG: hypothetical protein EA427_04030 [Spirochaetaceae bacterium]|nr:MAG: hypothetical protein EA427_04030 [Spirochaetaceae bacterium]
MTAALTLLVNGSVSARRSARAVEGSRDWNVLDVSALPPREGDPPALLAHLVRHGTEIIVIPLAVAARISRHIPERIRWIAYGTERDIQRAFFLGAADYLSDPWSEFSLLARTARITGSTEGIHGSVVVTGRETVVLRGREKALWETLCRHEGRVIDRSALAEAIGLRSSGGSPSRGVDMAIHRLRRRLGEEAERIESVRYRGYRLRDIACG